MFNGKKLLIVDDSKVERSIIRKIAEGLMFEVFESETAIDGILKAEEIKPNLIIMDVVMPGINGFQATRQLALNELLANTPIILCTSKNQPTDKLWGLRQGAKSYIVKPVNRAVLVEEIKKVMKFT